MSEPANGIKVERNLARALQPFIIKAALPHILSWLAQDGVRVAFSDRKSRTLGYYMPPKTETAPFLSHPKGFDTLHTISLQIDLNPYALLFVFVHEWAHLVTRRQYGDTVYPHGKEWKNNFKRLFQPFFSPEIFPADILEVIQRYFVKTSRYFEAEMEEACLRYGKNRKEFARTYLKLLKKGIAIPAPYMGEQAEKLSAGLQEDRQRQEMKRQIAEEKKNRPQEAPPEATGYTSAGHRKVAQTEPGMYIRMEGNEYRIVKTGEDFVLAQNLSTGKLARIHGLVEAEMLERG